MPPHHGRPGGDMAEATAGRKLPGRTRTQRRGALRPEAGTCFCSQIFSTRPPWTAPCSSGDSSRAWSISDSAPSDVAGTLRPPSRKQTEALRQVLLAGLLDNVARRARAGTVKAGSKLFRGCAYLSGNEAVTEPLYIKSTSVLFSRDPLELPESGWCIR
ncbi:unnamed protein product [Pylaiella littoralis]